MNAKCPECGKKLIAFRLIKNNGELMEEERDVMIKSENCLKIFRPAEAIDNPKPFSVYCIDPDCYYGISSCMDVIKPKRVGILTVSGNMHYTMGRD